MRKLTTRLAGLASIAALAASPALAQDFEIEHLAQIQNAGNLVVSGDGQTVAYTVSVPRNLHQGDEDGTPDTDLYVIRGASDPVRFIQGAASLSGLQFSPDGNSLYFRSKREGDGNTALYTLPLSGGEARKVFEFDTSIGDYALSPDGGMLYFVAQPKDDGEDLSDRGFRAYAYEEDDRLASIWSVALGEEDAEASVLFQGPHISDFELSPDGSRIVAAGAPTSLIDDFYMQRDLYYVNAESGEQIGMIDMPGKLGSFEISSNGNMLALHAGTDIHDTSDGVLMVADLRRGELTQLTADALQHVMDVDWMDEDSILTVAHRGVESALVVYNTNGSEERTLSVSSDIVVRTADVGDEEIRVVADSSSHPREVFAVRSRGSARLSNHNAWLGDFELAGQTTYSYEARDGRTIEGLLITPEGDAPEAGWPLILVVHGGPEAHYSDGWLTGYSTPGQFAAADGYAVFYPNYRGSTGRGVAFSKEHQGDYAGAEFNDLVDGVEALAADGTINRDRVGITGGSYGGYASMWGATALTEHFAAAVAFVGISNQISKFGTSDIPNEMHLVHSLVWPWDDNNANWLALLERSPVFWAGQARTPTLILHGEEDTRVHPSQSMELYRFMKVRTDTPVRLVFYPGEGHGNRRAAAQLDYAYRAMRWMDTYLAEGASRSDEMPDFDLGMAERLGNADEENGSSTD